MPLYFFTIPVLSPHRQAQDDLNCFVAAHRVLRLDRQLVYDAASAGVPEAQSLYFREQFRRRYAGEGDDAGPGVDS